MYKNEMKDQKKIIAHQQEEKLNSERCFVKKTEESPI